MQKTGLLFILSLFFGMQAHGENFLGARLLSQSQSKINVAWVFMQKQLFVEGDQVNGQKVFVQSNKVFVKGDPFCKLGCTGILSLNEQNNDILLNIYRLGAELVGQAPLNKKPIKIGSVAENGELKQLDARFQLDVLTLRTPSLPIWWFHDQETQQVGAKIILYMHLLPQDYSDTTF